MMEQQVMQKTSAAGDAALAATALSSPWWLDQLHTWIGAFMLVGGAILLCLRILIAYREWRGKRSGVPQPESPQKPR